ncbi:GUN4 domain-containing protein [Microcoleus sp. MON1_C5]|uniref:GUN4 domain-containing protein n=1 Tax=Microcoleus sp. MON1_C5 TaxID=2818828 RepID=UPI002FD20F8D
MIGKIRQIFNKFSILISRLPGSKKQRYYFFSVLLGLISFAVVGTGVLTLTRLIVSVVIFGASKLLWNLGVNTPQESRTNLEDNSQTGDRNINIDRGNYNESIHGNYIQGDYIEIQGCYINTNQELSDVVAEFREVVDRLKNQGYSADKAEEQVAQDLEEKARINPKVKKRVVNWAKSLNNTSTRINNEAEAAREVIKYAAASQYTSSAKSISVLGGKYSKLDSLLQARRWKEADEETEKMIFKLLGREKVELPSGNILSAANFDKTMAFYNNCLSGKDIEILPGTELRNINKLWLEHSKGRFGFSVQKRIWESIVRTERKPTTFDGCGGKEFDECVGWYVKGDWIYYSDIKYSLTAPPGHLPIKVMLNPHSTKCDCDQSIFRVFMKRQYYS